MTTLRAIAARFFPAAPRFDTVAIGDMTDSQLSRAGLSRAGMLHHTFSGLTTCG